MAHSDGNLEYVIADPAKEEYGDKYRRKSDYLPYDDDSESRPRKRPRITTREDPTLWKFQETLQSRLCELESEWPEGSLQRSLDAIEVRISQLEERRQGAEADTGATSEDHKSSQRLADLAVRISNLKRNKKIVYNLRSTITSPKFSCPDPDCKRTHKAVRTYREVGDLNKHFRESHGPLGSIAFRRACNLCGRSFPKTRDLILHERSDHGENYASRTEPCLPFFKQSQSTKDFIDLLPPNCRPSNGRPVDDLDLYNASTEFDLDGLFSAFSSNDHVENTWPTHNQEVDLYGGRMTPDIDTFLYGEVPGDATAILDYPSRQDGVAQSNSPNRPDPTALMPSAPSYELPTNTSPASSQHLASVDALFGALLDKNGTPGVSKLLSTLMQREVTDTGDGRNSVSISKTEMLGCVTTLLKLTGTT